MKKIIMLFISLSVVLLWSTFSLSVESDYMKCWFPPPWKHKKNKALEITKALSMHSGLHIKPKIAFSYPEIISAFSKKKPSIVYVGSFVQAIMKERGIGNPLLQIQNGKEFSHGVLIHPKGQDPVTILKNNPHQIAFAKGSSCGESCAKAATNGKAALATPCFMSTSAMVVSGRAKAGVVNNWWWETNSGKYPGLTSYTIPGISIGKNPENILTVSNSVTQEQRKILIEAAIASKETFGATQIIPFDSANLQFSIDLMKKGKLNPLTYTW